MTQQGNGTEPAQQPLGIEPSPQGYSVQPDPVSPLAQPPADAPPPNELAELRALRDKVGPMTKLVNELGGDALMQHYQNYAQMMQQQQTQPAQQPQQQPQDDWGGRLDNDPYGEPSRPDPEITQLREQVVKLSSQLGTLTHSNGMDKIEQHSRRFFQEEWPDLNADEQRSISDGMRTQFDEYARTEQGRNFLANPRYEAIRTLALQFLPPDKMEAVLRRKIAREGQGRAAMRTDSPTPSTGQEGIDLGTDAQTAWDRSLEAIQRETL